MGLLLNRAGDLMMANTDNAKVLRVVFFSVFITKV